MLGSAPVPKSYLHIGLQAALHIRCQALWELFEGRLDVRVLQPWSRAGAAASNWNRSRTRMVGKGWAAAAGMLVGVMWCQG